ncbi:uncharacterized protein [Asterias amurensis]|uniref:uncharacterized protein n=1 Tax=Asterias amurensis TaxID=7602 RepID=UPI003AB23066
MEKESGSLRKFNHRSRPTRGASDVQACGDTTSRRMAKEFDSLFPLYLIQPEEEIYRKMKLRNRTESLLFTKWASHLKPHIEQDVGGQARQRPLSTNHYRGPSIRRENPTTRQSFPPSQDVIRQPAMSHASGVGQLIPVHCPQRRDLRMGLRASSSPVFLVSMGLVPPILSQPTIQRKVMKRMDKTYFCK